jgi:hypothetical protein
MVSGEGGVPGQLSVCMDCFFCVEDIDMQFCVVMYERVGLLFSVRIKE